MAQPMEVEQQVVAEVDSDETSSLDDEEDGSVIVPPTMAPVTSAAWAASPLVMEPVAVSISPVIPTH